MKEASAAYMMLMEMTQLLVLALRAVRHCSRPRPAILAGESDCHFIE